MHKKTQLPYGLHIAIATIALLLLLVATVSGTIMSVNSKMRTYCFEELGSNSQRLKDELKSTMRNDKAMLTAMADIIASRNDYSRENLLKLMNTFSTTESYVTYVTVLLPDNTLLRNNGDTIGNNERFSFESEKEKGSYVSRETKGIFDPEERVILNVVPVVKNGEVKAILAGTVVLKELAKSYKADVYNGKAYVYLEDAETGDFLIDSWHKTLGNIKDFYDRKAVNDYSFERANDDLRKGKPGNFAFVSQSTGKILYMHYEPIGFNNWNIILTVDEETAFAKLKSISSDLYLMALLVGLSLLVYFAFAVMVINKIYRTLHTLDTEDSTTGLQNRSSYDDYIEANQNTLYEQATCIYIDANGLHYVNNTFGHDAGDKLLSNIALELKRRFAYKELYRIGGDEFVALCERPADEGLNMDLGEAIRSIEALGYSVSVGVSSGSKEEGWKNLIRNADEIMLANKRKYYEAHDRRR